MSPAGWLAVVLLTALGTGLFIVLTEGRFGGRRLVETVYDVAGPRLFARASDAGRWRALAGDVGLQPDARSLDVGSATGDLVLTWAALETFHGVAVGLDRSGPMLDAAEKLAAERGLAHRARFVEADAAAGLPFPEASFDVVTCLGLLEVIRRPSSLAAELARVLAPGGRLAVSLYRRPPKGVRALDFDGYAAMLRPLGFTAFEARPCRRHHDVVLATKGPASPLS
jgi:ubiquinone/menaquinone biosynthesis C-methylase UbiE